RLSDDAAAFDNRVVLLPERRPPLLVTVDVNDAALRRDVEHAVLATGRALLAPNGALVISDHQHPGEWVLEILSGANAVAHAGPFLVDRTHPITEGVDLDGVIWTAAGGAMPGTPIVLAGNQPLLTEDV